MDKVRIGFSFQKKKKIRKKSCIKYLGVKNIKNSLSITTENVFVSKILQTQFI